MRVTLKSTHDRSYPISFVGSIKEIARNIRRNYSPASIFVITDSNVGRLYGKELSRELPRSHTLVVPAGERSKSRAWKGRLEDALIDKGVARDSVIVALGGGMIGDLAGFTAATILRGVGYIQIPTSLLAQVDSSVGGKVAVDHPLGKNLIGAFHQPKGVYICVNTLRTLPEREYRNGLAEVIKYGAILDRSLFATLEDKPGQILARDVHTLQAIVRRCCELKRDVVERDERESGLRRILNFGHTIGHAVEQYSHYRLRHGEAIAIGMAVEADISCRCGLLGRADYERLTSLIASFGLPVSIPRGYHPSDILALATHDKKVSQGKVRYTLLKRIGRALPGQVVSAATVKAALAT